MPKPAESEPLQLTVLNFGPIAKAEIDLRPLTVFVGPSNTGKSYLAILIYALHRFFGQYTGRTLFEVGPMYPILRRRVSAQRPPDADSVRRIADWIQEVVEQIKTKKLSDGSRVQVPNFFASMIRPLFDDLHHSSEVLAEEMRRSFGLEDPVNLIRHGTRVGAKISLARPVPDTFDHSKRIEYELALRKSKTGGTVTSNSEDSPLYIDLNSERIMPVLDLGLDELNSLLSERDGHRRRKFGYFLREFTSLVLSEVFSPLSNTAHYLPADRTGVMHAHRAVVAALIELAPHAGLRRDTHLPELSGVLVDFLKGLVWLDDLPRRRKYKGNLAESLEQEILKGEIQRKDSETGYPVFSYLPHGWGKELPLMNASSMVSELAPVVLYLRHIVQSGDVLIIEEPESHLHPAMQVEFIRQLAAVVNAGVRVVLTTHSEWVLDELANLVRLSELPKGRRKGITGADYALNPQQVGVWLFEPKQRPKGSVVKEIPYDAEFGGFRSGFDEVAIGTYNDHAEISNRVEGLK